MRRPKIYLDTSVISHLRQNDVPDKMNDTLKLWEQIKQGMYEVYISNVTLEEIQRCYEPKRTLLLEYLSTITFQLIETISQDASTLVTEIIKQGILTQKSRDDCTHIAVAVVTECDIIVSWNFKHMVNVKTINGIRGISSLKGYRSIDIYSPSMLILGDD